MNSFMWGLGVLGVAALLIKIVMWRMAQLKKQRDEAIKEGNIAHEIIHNVKKANHIKARHAQLSDGDRIERMRTKGYLRSEK